MKYRNILFVGLFLIFGVSLFGQNDKKYIREGNKEFANENFEKSELSYRKAVELAKAPFKASFNVGDALYKQEKYDEAAKQFEHLSESDIDKAAKGAMYHNLGNSMLQSNKLEESIEAYKDALRNNPNDLETKYNLAFAQDKLKEQQQEQQQQNKDNKDQDKDKDKDQENKDNQDQQNKDQENKDNKDNKDKQDQNQDQDKNNQDKQQQQQQPNQISKEDAARILQALQNQEKEIQDKVKKAKAVKAKVKTTTNW